MLMKQSTLDTLGVLIWLWFKVGKYDRGAATEQNLTADNAETRVMTFFAKRDVLSVQGQFFYPPLILSPSIVKLRLLFRVGCEEIGPENWNTQLTLGRRKEFIGIFKQDNNNFPHQSGLQQSSLTKRSSGVQESHKCSGTSTIPTSKRLLHLSRNERLLKKTFR